MHSQRSRLAGNWPGRGPGEPDGWADRWPRRGQGQWAPFPVPDPHATPTRQVWRTRPAAPRSVRDRTKGTRAAGPTGRRRPSRNRHSARPTWARPGARRLQGAEPPLALHHPQAASGNGVPPRRAPRPDSSSHSRAPAPSPVSWRLGPGTPPPVSIWGVASWKPGLDKDTAQQAAPVPEVGGAADRRPGGGPRPGSVPQAVTGSWERRLQNTPLGTERGTRRKDQPRPGPRRLWLLCRGSGWGVGSIASAHRPLALQVGVPWGACPTRLTAYSQESDPAHASPARRWEHPRPRDGLSNTGHWTQQLGKLCSVRGGLGPRRPRSPAASVHGSLGPRRPRSPAASVHGSLGPWRPRSVFQRSLRDADYSLFRRLVSFD